MLFSLYNFYDKIAIPYIRGGQKMLNNLTIKKDIRTFSVCPENPTGEKGNGGKATLEEGSARMDARELGQGWKVRGRRPL